MVKPPTTAEGVIVGEIVKQEELLDRLLRHRRAELVLALEEAETLRKSVDLRGWMANSVPVETVSSEVEIERAIEHLYSLRKTLRLIRGLAREER